MKKTYALGLVGLVVLATLGYFFFRSQSSWLEVSPTEGPIVEAVYGLGTVKAKETFNLKIGVTSSVSQVFAAEGDFVKINQPLLQLEDLGVYKAPFTGTVTGMHFKKGENVFPQATILSLVNLVDLYVEVSLEQQGALRVQRGQIAFLSFESLRGQRIQGQVLSVFPSQGQFLVHISVKEMPDHILPGMTADVAVEVGRKEKGILIPLSAVHSGQILLKSGARKLKTNVKIGIVDGERAEVLEPNLKLSDVLYVKK